MAEIVAFVSKSERERLSLIREARAIYDSIFPPTDVVGVEAKDQAGNGDATGLKRPAAPSKENVRMMGRS